MEQFISSLVESLTFSSFFDVFKDLVALLVIIVPIVLGFYLIGKMIKINRWMGLDYEDLVEEKDKEQWLKDHRFF